MKGLKGHHDPWLGLADGIEDAPFDAKLFSLELSPRQQQAQHQAEGNSQIVGQHASPLGWAEKRPSDLAAFPAKDILPELMVATCCEATQSRKCCLPRAAAADPGAVRALGFSEAPIFLENDHAKD